MTVTITPGTDAVSTSYEIDGGATQTGTSVLIAAPASHENDGVHTVTYRSVDAGGTPESDKTATAAY